VVGLELEGLETNFFRGDDNVGMVGLELEGLETNFFRGDDNVGMVGLELESLETNFFRGDDNNVLVGTAGTGIQPQLFGSVLTQTPLDSIILENAAENENNETYRAYLKYCLEIAKMRARLKAIGITLAATLDFEGWRASGRGALPSMFF
jgi:hypothetical protein